MAKAILRLPAASGRIGLARSSIYDRLNPKSSRYDPTFPRPVPLGKRAIGFLEDEVEAWVTAQAEQRETAAAAKWHPNKPTSRRVGVMHEVA